MTFGDAEAVVLSVLEVNFVFCGINLPQATSPKVIALITLKHHCVVLLRTASTYSVGERRNDASTYLREDDSPILVPEPCVDEPLLVMGFPIGQKHS